MTAITLVTGNKGKLKEWRRLLPPEFKMKSMDMDLDEIQSLDLDKIAIHKAKSAYDKVNGPVLVEDISAGLDKLNGLPGPFIKFFETELGDEALYKLAGDVDSRAGVTCVVAYYDGQTVLTAKAVTLGMVVAKRGNNGFGFDKVFMPDGSQKTYGEMSASEKDRLSQRSKAVSIMVSKLKQHIKVM